MRLIRWPTHPGGGHDRVRKAYNLLTTQARKGTLFQYLQPDLLNQVQTPVSSTTNHIEGGINAPFYAACSHNTAACGYLVVDVLWNGGCISTLKRQHLSIPLSNHRITIQQHGHSLSNRNPSDQHCMTGHSQPKKASASNKDGKASNQT